MSNVSYDHYAAKFGYGAPGCAFGQPNYKCAPQNKPKPTEVPVNESPSEVDKTSNISQKSNTQKPKPRWIAQISKYERPVSGTVSQKIQWFFFRLWNAVKAIFGKSDWQIVKKKLSAKLINDAESKVKNLESRSSEIPLAKQLDFQKKLDKAKANAKTTKASAKFVAEFLLNLMIDKKINKEDKKNIPETYQKIINVSYKTFEDILNQALKDPEYVKKFEIIKNKEFASKNLKDCEVKKAYDELLSKKVFPKLRDHLTLQCFLEKSNVRSLFNVIKALNK